MKKQDSLLAGLQQELDKMAKESKDSQLELKEDPQAASYNKV